MSPLADEPVSHTPGPWSCEPIWSTPITKVHAVVEGQARALADVHTMWNAGEREANARLIAAAPELFAVCKELFEDHPSLLCHCGQANCATTRLRAALAKAEGRS